ncbi:MAG: L,D-transpeptidase family protein [Daejeonella sp.]|uniref:L,D-transpeptidase family protein n=1 Tax=Daejeonella sp. TaxID=2805397 RepID=UPI002732468D|nr:L,D-transpeptidase family protein [Daejeonella sp.]MDP3468664.1 L,D-transpeptidase family protein [Daejeonella sp.]
MNINNPVYLFLLIMVSLLPFQGCSQDKKNTLMNSQDSLRNHDMNEWNKSIPGSFSTQSKSKFDSLEIGVFLSQYPKLKKYERNISTFYSRRNMAFAWFDKKGLIEHAANLTDRVRNLQYDGVNKELPYLQSLDSLIFENSLEKLPDSSMLKLELMLTAQYFAFADVVWEGMDASISRKVDWNLPRKRVSYEVFLDSILKTAPEQIKDLKRPVNRQYGLLRKFLQNYSELEQKGKWFEIKASVKSLRPGDSSDVIVYIKQRLNELGDLKIDDGLPLYDEYLKTAVSSFQLRHGLKDDGIIGKTTLAEMNVPFKQRIKQLIVNMERSRWVPASLSSEYLVVNIPEFKLHVNSGDKLLWSCNIVVGKPIHKTAVFSGELKYVVFSPYWNIPKSIVINEVLKDMRRDRNYLNKNNMEITGYRDGIPEIRQRPGPTNSLGLVKFLFPNNYNMYLHDTPAKSLFNEPSRAFSHGCMRVQEPFKLAQFLLKNDPFWDDEKINAAMNAGTERTVTLKEGVPVFIVYFTAFVDRDGKINFRKDIYERDERMAEMMLIN